MHRSWSDHGRGSTEKQRTKPPQSWLSPTPKTLANIDVASQPSTTQWQVGRDMEAQSRVEQPTLTRYRAHLVQSSHPR